MQAPIRNRYLAGFLLASLILTCVGVGVIVAAKRTSASNAKVNHTHDVIAQVGEIRALLFRAISLQRNYLLTDDRSYLDEYRLVPPALHRELSGLSALVGMHPTRKSEVQRLEALVQQRLDSAEEALQVYHRDGLTAAQDFIRSSQGRIQTNEIESISSQIVSDEQALLAQRAEQSRRDTWFLLATGALAIPISVAILAWLYVLLTREVRVRQRAVQDTADANLRLADSVHDLERVGSELQELARTGSQLQSCRNVPEALAISRHSLASLVGECAGTIYLLRESQDYAEAEVSWGEHAIPTDPILQPSDCWALRRGQPYLVKEYRQGLACNHMQGAEEVRGNGLASICLPLVAQGVGLGMIYLSGRHTALIPHVDLVSAAAEQLSLALGNLRLQETLRHQSIRDPLTGLYNRRYLHESLPRELARCSRRDLPLSVLMLDMDHFKSLNDQHGHDGGDAVLSAFGRLLQASSREEDIPCRYGGEEFVLVLPEAGLEAARRRADDIRRAVETMSVRHLQRDIGDLTVSIGLASSPEHGSSPDALKRLADEALYRAKHAGRNRVEVASLD